MWSKVSSFSFSLSPGLCLWTPRQQGELFQANPTSSSTKFSNKLCCCHFWFAARPCHNWFTLVKDDSDVDPTTSSFAAAFFYFCLFYFSSFLFNFYCLLSYSFQSYLSALFLLLDNNNSYHRKFTVLFILVIEKQNLTYVTKYLFILYHL